MQHILRKKMWRELKSNWLRYLVLALMIIASMYIIVSLIGAADTIIIGTEEHGRKNKTEDGQFTVFVSLQGSVLKDLEDRGLTVEEMFYLDYELDGGNVLRLFKLRENIDLVEAEEGELPEKDNQIALEKRYCEKNEIARGDTVSIAGHTFTVTAIVTFPDYDGVFREMGDSTADSAKFGPAFVTEDAYQELKDSVDDLVDEFMPYDLSNLRSFVKSSENPRIAGGANDVVLTFSRPSRL